MSAEVANPEVRKNKTYITLAIKITRNLLTPSVNLQLLKEKLKYQAIIKGMNRLK
jgi:hypothetical protein